MMRLNLTFLLKIDIVLQQYKHNNSLKAIEFNNSKPFTQALKRKR